MLKKIALLLCLIIIVIGAMGCGEGIKQPGRISGTVFFGGEPATALPNPGISSLSTPFATLKRAAFNANHQTNPTSLIVTCDPKLSETAQQESLRSLGFEIIRQLYSDHNKYVVKPLQTNNLELSYRSSLNAGSIKAVEYNFPVRALSTTPNDEFYQTRQWDMMVTKFNEAWDNYKGQNSVVIAVLDTGINVDSPELSGRMVDTENWYDFSDNDNDPREPTGFDYDNYDAHQYSHGTNVTGIIGSKPDNGLGYAGAAWDETKIKIMPIRVLGTDGRGGFDGVIDGIRWAVVHGAKVISLSLGADSYYNSVLLNDAVAYARDHNVTLVCAAGNENTAINYPARLSISYPNVIAVGATGYTNTKAFYSCYGPELTVMAPGGDFEGTYTQGYIWNITFDKMADPQTEYYEYGFCGTSQATPHVSALAAMLYSYGITDPKEIRDIIRQTATDLGDKGRDNLYGDGLINAFAAMTRATQTDVTDVPLITLGIRSPSTKKDVTAKIHPNDSGEFMFPVLPMGKYELYGTFDLPSGYKYEGAVLVSVFSDRTGQILPLLLLPD